MEHANRYCPQTRGTSNNVHPASRVVVVAISAQYFNSDQDIILVEIKIQVGSLVASQKVPQADRLLDNPWDSPWVTRQLEVCNFVVIFADLEIEF